MIRTSYWLFGGAVAASTCAETVEPDELTSAIILLSPTAATHLSWLKSQARHWLESGIGDAAPATAVLEASNAIAMAVTFANVNLVISLYTARLPRIVQ
jgi:hypothetical protein